MNLSSITDENELRRRYLFRLCESKQELHDWILIFLGLDLPDCTVYVGVSPEADSNSNPMDMVWEMYTKMLDGTDESFMRVLYYASRDSFKTLSAAVVEVLAVLHCNRNVAHMAAIQEQALKAQEYVKRMFRRPHLRDFIVGNNERTTKIIRYYNPTTQHSLTAAEFADLSASEQAKHEEMSRVLSEYREKEKYIKVVICTMAGANCIDPASMITMSDGSKKIAMDVEIGDLVRGFDTGTKEFITNRIADKGLTEKPAVRLSFQGGGSVVVSDDHQIFTNSGWAHARGIRVGDLCFDASGEKTSPSGHEGVDLLAHDGTRIWNPWSVLVGTLLGDASITWPKNRKGEKYGRGPRIQFFHCEKQKEYLHHKVSILSKIGFRFNVCKDGSGLKATSNVDERLIPLFDMFYRSGYKKVTQDILDKVDEEALSFWIQDDGRGGPYRVGTSKDHCLELATCCFSHDENELIVRWLLDSKGISSRIGTVSNGKKKYPIVVISLDSSRELSERISKFFHHSMRYKLPSPNRMLVGRCIECSCLIGRREVGRFSRCTGCPNPNTRKKRESFVLFKSKFIHKIIKIENLETRTLLDLHIDTNNDNRRNFVANNSLLLHNSEHCPLFCIDEVDVVSNPTAYEESQSIPAGSGGKLPITLLTSTRKQAFGLVQKEIDRAAKSGLQIRHWNIIDVTTPCPPSRHKPELPKLKLYVNNTDLRHTDEAGYKELNFKEKEKFSETTGYAGCRSCRLFTGCRGRLATEQTSTSTMLKSIPEVIGKFNALSVEMACAQLLCLKPSSTGLIYSRFDKTRHVLSPAQAYFKIFGEHVSDPKQFTKAMFIDVVRRRGVDWYGGLDWGHTHNFAYVHGFKDGPRFFLTHCISVPELDPDQMLDVCEPFKEDQPSIYPDTADPKMNKLFKKNGHRMMNWSKGPGSVVGGIQIVRWMMNPPMGDCNFFIVHDIDEDLHIDTLVNNIAEYHWKVDSGNNPTNVPSEEKDDEADAVRYVLMNVFSAASGITVGKTTQEELGVPTAAEGQQPDNWMTRLISEKTGGDTTPHQRPGMTIEVPDDSAFSSYYSDSGKKKKDTDGTQGRKGRKGRLTWDL
jgi:hypothetical protein